MSKRFATGASAAQYARLYAPRGRAQNKVVEWRPNSWQVDTMFFPLRGKLRAILCAVEVTTRVAYAHVYTHAKPTGAETVHILEKMAEKHKIQHLSVDRGVEYVNERVQGWCAKHGITLHYFDTAVPRDHAHIESFNKSLKRLLTEWTHFVSPAWNQATLTLAIEFYNRRNHSGIGMAPADVTPEDAERIREEAWAAGEAYRDMLAKFTPGTTVRVFMGADPDASIAELKRWAFAHKEGPRWTAKTWTVRKLDGWKVLLEGVPRRRFSPRDLLIVDAEAAAAPQGAADMRALANLERGRTARALFREGLTEAARALLAKK